MRATEVEDFVRTSSDKEFSRADLTRGYLRITGDIMNSYSKNATVRIGGCWYNSITGVWEKTAIERSLQTVISECPSPKANLFQI